AQHTSPRIHACGECGKTFATSSGLKQHAHIHSSVKPFQCEVCLKSYTQFSNLCRHKRMHADCRAQSRCDKCSAPFASSAALAKHKRFCDAASSPLKNRSLIETPLNNNSQHIGGERSAMFQFQSTTTTVGTPLTVKKLMDPSDPDLLQGPTDLHTSKAKKFNINSLHVDMKNLNNNNNNHIHRNNYGLRRRSRSPLLSAGSRASTAANLHNSKDDATIRENVGRLGFPAALMFPPSPPMYNPFTTMAIYPQFFATPTNLSRLDHGGEVMRKTSLRVSSSTSPHRDNTDLLLPTGSRKSRRNPSLDKEEANISDDENEEDVDDGFYKPKKSDTPLDLSVQKNESCENGNKKDVIEDLSKVKIKTGIKERETREQSCNNNSSEREKISLSESKSKMVLRGERELRVEDNNMIPCPNNKKAKFRCNSFQLIPPPHQIMDGLNISMETANSKQSGFSPIIAPRPLHPFSRFPIPSSHFSALQGFHPNPFNPFFHSNLSPRNDLSNNLNASSPTWQGKVGNRYSCKFCGKVFPRSANLTRHLRTHTGEQPYKCRFCERSFSISSNLQRHVRNIHHKEKPFRCPLCDRAFGQQTNLDRHLRKHESGVNMDHDSSNSPTPSPQ
ncbi:unnamed protein product, partial [Allacma fusca]